MILTCASSYALLAVAHMAQQNSKKPMASHTIAKAWSIPDRFLLKVLKPLVSANPPILKSIKGPNGGYELARPPAEISMLEIIEAADQGQIQGTQPLTGKGNASLNKKLESICKETAEVVRKHLKRVRVSDLVGGKKPAGN